MDIGTKCGCWYNVWVLVPFVGTGIPFVGTGTIC